MARKSMMEREIYIYTCMNDPTQPCVAVFAGLWVMIRGKTPFQARQNAENWRRDMIAKDKLLSDAEKQRLLGVPV